MRYLKRNKRYNFSLEEFLLMARDGVYNFSSGNETKATTIDKAGSSEKVEKTEVADSKPVTEEAPKQTVQDYFYQVNKGDTLGGIAQRAGTTVDDIMLSNKDLIKDKNNIQIGWNLRLPSNSARVQYAFEEGDTGMGIAKKIGALWKDIESANPGTDWNKVPIGYKIWVPRYNNVSTAQEVPVVSTVQSVAEPTTVAAKSTSESKTTSTSNSEKNASTNEDPYLKDGINRYKSENWVYRRADKNYSNLGRVEYKDIDPKDLIQNVYSDGYGVFTLNGGPVMYTIKSGDSFEKIAKENNTTVDRLKMDNKGVNPSKLRIGQKIKLQKLNSNISGFNLDLVDRNQPIEFEGFDSIARKGVNEPHYTMGYGHHSANVKKGQNITEKEAYAIYKNDINDVYETIKTWNANPKLNKYQYQVLLDYGFNAGTGNLKKILVDYVNKGKLKEAIKHMTPSTRYDINPGLRDRHDWRKSYWGLQN